LKKTFIFTALTLVLCMIVGCSLTACKNDYELDKRKSEGNSQYPPADIIASLTYDVTEEMDKQNNDIDKGIALLKYTAYNTINSQRFSFTVDMTSELSSYTMRSQYYYIRENRQVGETKYYDYYKQIISNVTDSSNPLANLANTGARRMRYMNHRLVCKAKSTSFDVETDTVIADWKDKLDENKEQIGEKETERKEVLYKTFECTLDIEDRNQIESCTITTMDDGNGHQFYRLVINTNVTALNNNTYTMDNLANDISLSSDTEYTGYTLTYDIWACGLFRSATVEEEWTGKITGLGSQEAYSTREYEYSYATADCSIAKVLQDTGYVQYLSDAEKTNQSAEYGALGLEE